MDVTQLLGKHSNGVYRFVLCEAKDIGLPMQKPFWLDQLTEKLQHASRQVERKSDWFRAAWQQISRDCFGFPVQATDRAYLARLVVTARYVPPYLLIDCSGVPVAGFGVLLEKLARVPPENWKEGLLIDAEILE